MRVDRINYQKTFNLGNYTSERIGMEAELTGEEDAGSALLALKEKVHNFHEASNPEPLSSFIRDEVGATKPPTPPPVIYRRAIERMEILIDDAKTIEELAIYKEDASKHGLVEQYMNRLKQLS